jgi:hypothetical protein
VSRQASCLLAVFAFFFVLLGTERSALASRIVAPMCAPDGQSMPAPLQLKPTSDAKIEREAACPTLENTGWDILPQVPSVPANWNCPASDPLWLALDMPVVSRAHLLGTFVPKKSPKDKRSGYATGVYRPPR